MNNKIFKRVVAAASCVAMLGTCAFATTLTVGETPYNASTGELTFSYAAPENATKVTYIAYAATEAETAGGGTNGTDYVFGEIVAVDQIDSGVTTAVTPKTVKISSDLLYMDADAAEADKVAATHIVLMAGNDLGTTPEPIAVPLEEEEPAVTVTFMNGATEVAKVTADETGKVVLPTSPGDLALSDEDIASGKYAITKLTFVGWADENDSVTYESDITGVTEDTVLYAKYYTGFIYGDTNGDGRITAPDRGNLHDYITSRGAITNAMTGRLVSPYTGKTMAGDTNGDGRITAPDRGNLHDYITSRGAITNSSTSQKIFYINK